MIKSKTKYEATLEEIRELFSFHKIGNVKSIAPLGNGEFNSAYTKRTDLSYQMEQYVCIVNNKWSIGDDIWK